MRNSAQPLRQEFLRGLETLLLREVAVEGDPENALMQPWFGEPAQEKQEAVLASGQQG